MSRAQATPVPEDPHPLARRAAIVVATLHWIVVVTFVVSLFARVWYLAELITHFYPHLLAASTVLLVAVAFHRRVWQVLGQMIIAVWIGLMVLPVYGSQQNGDRVGRSFRVVTANLNSGNREHELLISYLRKVEPDVILLQEIDDAWATSLRALEDTWPHNIVIPKIDNFGIALFSRHPIVDQEISEPAAVGLYQIRVTIDTGYRHVQLYNVHTMPPVGSKFARIRNTQLRQLADAVGTAAEPTIVAGDLNVTPWSPYFADLLEDGALCDARYGNGIMPTWPAFSVWAGIPIDHVLYSGHFAPFRFGRGPDIGSDHLPLFADVILAE